MDPLNVLIRLIKGYGLGDAVQMSAVLKHVRKHRPHWLVDFQAERGREKVGRGIVRNIFTYDEQYPSTHYDAEVHLLLHDTFANWSDRPNTRVTSCLHERFGLRWDRECARYEVNISRKVCHEVCRFLDTFRQEPTRTIDAEDAGLYVGEDYPSEWLKYLFVCVHYLGDSDKTNKDLTHSQAAAVCNSIVKFGKTPLLLDYRGVSPLGTHYPTTYYRREWGGDAEYQCAVIAQCEAFVGIDSGPSKCAAATDTPSLVVWTGHHPAPFHDPAPNTTHLVPVGYHGLQPVLDDPGVIRFFEASYNVRKYDRDPVLEIERWLLEVLKG